MKSDYTIEIIAKEANGEDVYCFAIFHPSVKTPVMFSPYLHDIRKIIELGQLLAFDLELLFINPFEPRPQPPKKVVRKFKLIQGGKSDERDLQTERETLLREENDDQR